MSHPYQPSLTSCTYYVFDELRLSYRSLWRMLRKLGVIWRTMVFLWFAIRKLIGWRFRADYGRLRPETLYVIEIHQLPSDVQAAVQPGIQSIRSAGFECLAVTNVPHIGSMREYCFVFASVDKPVVAALTWTRLTIGRTTNASVRFHCASFLTGNRQLHTSASVGARQFAELIPPWIEIDWLPESASIEQVIEHHAAAIAVRADLQSVPLAQTLDLMVANSQRTFDHLVQKGLLRALTPSEFSALCAVQDESVVVAELA